MMEVLSRGLCGDEFHGFLNGDPDRLLHRCLAEACEPAGQRPPAPPAAAEINRSALDASGGHDAGGARIYQTYVDRHVRGSERANSLADRCSNKMAASAVAVSARGSERGPK